MNGMCTAQQSQLTTFHHVCFFAQSFRLHAVKTWTDKALPVKASVIANPPEKVPFWRVSKNGGVGEQLEYCFSPAQQSLDSASIRCTY